MKIEDMTDTQLIFQALLSIAKRQALSHMQLEKPSGDIWKEIYRRANKEIK